MPQNVPSTLSEFAQQAKDFIGKAKESGKSNTAISNTINFMFTMFQMESDKQNKLKDTQWLDSDGDGIADTLVDNQTGEVISNFGASTSGVDDVIFDIVNEGESQYDDLFSLSEDFSSEPAGQTSDISNTGELDLASFADKYGSSDQPMSMGQEALKKVSDATNKKGIDPVTGKERGIDISNLQGISMQPGFFQQQQDPNKLSLGGFQLPKIRF